MRLFLRRLFQVSPLRRIKRRAERLATKGQKPGDTLPDVISASLAVYYPHPKAKPKKV